MIQNIRIGQVFRLGLLLVFLVLVMQIQSSSQVGVAASGRDGLMKQKDPMSQGPFIQQSAIPSVYDGDLRDLPPDDETQVEFQPIPLKYVPGTEPKGGSTTIANWRDPVAQTVAGIGLMPSPVMNFPGMSLSAGGAGWPPDTNGDVGPEHYIQTTKIAPVTSPATKITRVARMTFQDFTPLR